MQQALDIAPAPFAIGPEFATDIAAREAPRCALVDAARPREAVAADILALVRARLGSGGTDGHGA